MFSYIRVYKPDALARHFYALVLADCKYSFITSSYATYSHVLVATSTGAVSVLYKHIRQASTAVIRDDLCIF